MKKNRELLVTYLAIFMAGRQTRYSPRRNTFSGGNKPIRNYDRALFPTKENVTPTHTPAMSRDLIYTLAPPPSPALTLALAIPVAWYSNKNLQQATYLSLNLFIEEQQQAQAALGL